MKVQNMMTKQQQTGDEKAKRAAKAETNPVKEFFSHPLVKGIIIAGMLYTTLYVSKYFLNAMADAVRAGKNFRNAINE